ncbi:hypothetical protein EV651_103325 [Kribbella sp. VKM Ac-2571]|uniref:hypothetical protein n=1 Tax=Kribbella sp. VKM Ac-2571 TaxID=2512222 RepID=UPI0010608A73|nr:hypothetical protein [Kribbella sp. VKM Ac-2571]TDO67413.1 hypothetical protein EV651_103325 [Kribbella sp. VKM Ac-2571]
MEHSTGTPTNPTPHAPLNPPPPTTQAQAAAHAGTAAQAQGAAQTQAAAQAAAQVRAERRARADWLITELSRLAAQADNPNDRVRIRRTADSLTRLATAFRP